MIKNDENDCDHNVIVDAVEGPVECVCRDEVMQTFNEMKIQNDTSEGPP